VVESDSLTFECVFPSPDGTRALLSASSRVWIDPTTHRFPPGFWAQLYQMAIDGRELRPLVQMPGYGKDPRWSTDGRSVVFLGSTWPGFFTDSGSRGDSIEIFTADSDGKNLRLLTNNRYADIHPSW